MPFRRSPKTAVHRAAKGPTATATVAGGQANPGGCQQLHFRRGQPRVAGGAGGRRCRAVTRSAPLALPPSLCQLRRLAQRRPAELAGAATAGGCWWLFAQPVGLQLGSCGQHRQWATVAVAQQACGWPLTSGGGGSAWAAARRGGLVERHDGSIERRRARIGPSAPEKERWTRGRPPHADPTLEIRVLL